MPGFGPASAPMASRGVLGFLEAPSSYKIDYSEPYKPANVSREKRRRWHTVS